MVNKGLLGVISAMAVFGSIGVFVRAIPLPSAEIALWRAVIAISVIAAYKLIKREKIPLTAIKNDIFPLALSGAAIGFNWILLFEAFNHTSVSAATLAYYFAPTLVMIFSPIILKERLTLKQCLCFIGATLGLVLMIGGSSGEYENEILGIIFGLGAACLYAFTLITNKRITSVSGADRTILQFVTALIVLLIYVPATTNLYIAGIDTWGLLSLLTLGAVHTGIAYCVFYGSIGSVSGQQLALFSYVYPLVAVILSVALLRETVTILQIAGGFIIIVFSVVNELSSTKLKAKS